MRLLFAILALGLVACSSIHRVGSPLPEGYVLTGERIEITGKDGRTWRTRKIHVMDDSLHFDGRALDLAEIERIEKKEFSGLKTTLLVWATTGVVASILLIPFLLHAYGEAMGLFVAGH